MSTHSLPHAIRVSPTHGREPLRRKPLLSLGSMLMLRPQPSATSMPRDVHELCRQSDAVRRLSFWHGAVSRATKWSRTWAEDGGILGLGAGQPAAHITGSTHCTRSLSDSRCVACQARTFASSSASVTRKFWLLSPPHATACACWLFHGCWRNVSKHNITYRSSPSKEL